MWYTAPMDRNDKAIRTKQLGMLLIAGGMFAMIYGGAIAMAGGLTAFAGLVVFIAGRANQ